jgi:hypothetical protein
MPRRLEVRVDAAQIVLTDGLLPFPLPRQGGE